MLIVAVLWQKLGCKSLKAKEACALPSVVRGKF